MKTISKTLLKIGMSLMIVFVAIYVCCFTNVIFNHSCVGITYGSESNSFGVDLIIRYFDSEREANKCYKSEKIESYLIAAVDVENKKDYDDTHDWFCALEYPLVAENIKYVSVSSFDLFAEMHELLLYDISDSLRDGVQHKDVDNTIELYDLGYGWLSVSDNCTEVEKSFYMEHCMFAFSMGSNVERYQISVKQNDEFSSCYWLLQLEDLCSNWKAPSVPKTKRDGIDWIKFSDRYTEYLNVFKNILNKNYMQTNLDENDLSLMITTALAYEAAVIELFADLNSDLITPIDKEIDVDYWKELFNVPSKMDVVIEISDPYYWETGERELINVGIYDQNGGYLAGAACDSISLEMVRNIWLYHSE